ncbi:MAG: hypothetical protein KGR48_02415 [Alphaproteobacteria bacterium]|nr:hypothetical protein [Alphaproteobacteria bacterium]MBU6473476.1 hypothetical protein [Alphaproteobacteria bacterium]MDE2014592.1 hypothetical protein [Alphaproteobacteria bacterium]MDE2074383.1 hypothetical protein [Alphaproteobacteria bacterium]MDE2351391.1 hypothetical protein [Alphaproteobacteria bacterium]
MHRIGLNIAVVMAALLLAAMAILAAVGFAALALYLYLAPLTGAAMAALATALASLVFVLLVAGLAALLVRRPRKAAGDFSGLADALGIGESLGAEGRAFLSTHLSKASLVLFGLGLVMGVSPRLRKLITDLLLR